MAEKRAFQLWSVGILKSVKISWPNSNHKVFLSQESNIEMLKGSGSPPSLNPTLWNLGILHYKQAKLHKHLPQSIPVRFKDLNDSNLILNESKWYPWLRPCNIRPYPLTSRILLVPIKSYNLLRFSISQTRNWSGTVARYKKNQSQNSSVFSAGLLFCDWLKQ